MAYDATQATYNQQADVLIIDTAGRLQSKHNLMRELEKIRNVVRKRYEYAPHEVLLVIDAHDRTEWPAPGQGFRGGR
ncbi:MAG: hypothetical protein KatS3mg057_0692 [Herpetosiphonaceae bacterium]|nr:MAG: hypothetical protein KatS3mg057_0692 [Herpetosiphonaceae bacterium]